MREDEAKMREDEARAILWQKDHKIMELVRILSHADAIIDSFHRKMMSDEGIDGVKDYWHEIIENIPNIREEISESWWNQPEAEK